MQWLYVVFALCAFHLHSSLSLPANNHRRRPRTGTNLRRRQATNRNLRDLPVPDLDYVYANTDVFGHPAFQDRGRVEEPTENKLEEIIDETPAIKTTTKSVPRTRRPFRPTRPRNRSFSGRVTPIHLAVQTRATRASTKYKGFPGHADPRIRPGYYTNKPGRNLPVDPAEFFKGDDESAQHFIIVEKHTTPSKAPSSVPPSTRPPTKRTRAPSTHPRPTSRPSSPRPRPTRPTATIRPTTTSGTKSTSRSHPTTHTKAVTRPEPASEAQPVSRAKITTPSKSTRAPAPLRTTTKKEELVEYSDLPEIYEDIGNSRDDRSPNHFDSFDHPPGTVPRQPQPLHAASTKQQGYITVPPATGSPAAYPQPQPSPRPTSGSYPAEQTNPDPYEAPPQTSSPRPQPYPTVATDPPPVYPQPPQPIPPRADTYASAPEPPNVQYPASTPAPLQYASSFSTTPAYQIEPATTPAYDTAPPQPSYPATPAPLPNYASTPATPQYPAPPQTVITPIPPANYPEPTTVGYPAPPPQPTAQQYPKQPETSSSYHAIAPKPQASQSWPAATQPDQISNNYSKDSPHNYSPPQTATTPPRPQYPPQPTPSYPAPPPPAPAVYTPPQVPPAPPQNLYPPQPSNTPPSAYPSRPVTVYAPPIPTAAAPQPQPYPVPAPQPQTYPSPIAAPQTYPSASQQPIGGTYPVPQTPAPQYPAQPHGPSAFIVGAATGIEDTPSDSYQTGQQPQQTQYQPAAPAPTNAYGGSNGASGAGGAVFAGNFYEPATPPSTASGSAYGGNGAPPQQSIPVIPACGQHAALCGSLSQCIPANKVCDGNRDCPDGSDERACQSPVRCWPAEFACVSLTQCVPLLRRCDGRDDCYDKSDEEGCSEREIRMLLGIRRRQARLVSESELNQKRTTRPRKLPDSANQTTPQPDLLRTRLVTVERIVPERSKQPQVTETAPSITAAHNNSQPNIELYQLCQSNQFRCDGRCVDSKLKCDGKFDCRDRSDEPPQLCVQAERDRILRQHQARQRLTQFVNNRQGRLALRQSLRRRNRKRQ